MEELNKGNISNINYKPFGILLFYAKGCHHCEKIKPLFEEYSEKFPTIQFAKIEMGEGIEYYNKFADKVQALKYEPKEEGSEQMVAIPQWNEDGTPMMVTKYSVPSFFVHHVDAKGPDNEFGYIGGFDGALSEELGSVIHMILNFK